LAVSIKFPATGGKSDDSRKSQQWLAMPGDKASMMPLPIPAIPLLTHGSIDNAVRTFVLVG
tara:strand:- start:621 stop:803 length:183 start_codon:yes stop_codon:yes gene_type:complete